MPPVPKVGEGSLAWKRPSKYGHLARVRSPRTAAAIQRMFSMILRLRRWRGVEAREGAG